jgi:homoserine O-succinyltransferase
LPIKIPKSLPAYQALLDDNVFVMAEGRASHQDIRPLEIAIVNLMPTTIATETQLLRLLGNTPLQVNITFIHMGSHDYKHAPQGHLEEFYTDSKTAMRKRYDALIITGAPVETLRFEDVDYWDELCRVIDWSAENVWSVLHICWGAQASLYRRYGIQKVPLDKKRFGVFPHRVVEKTCSLFRGFDDVFFMPHSRHTALDDDAALACPALKALAKAADEGSGGAGEAAILGARGEREVYITGHIEYDALTLDAEYRRDLSKGLPIEAPCNYYIDNNLDKPPRVLWRSAANLFYYNWLNFVYQETPFELSELHL